MNRYALELFVGCRLTGGVAGLEGKRVDEKVEEDDVALGAGRVGVGRRGKPVRADEGGVYIV